MIINLVVDRFEGEMAVLTGEGGVAVTWPKNKLPENVREGSNLSFEIMAEKDKEEKSRQTAKDIINEIINQP